MWYVFAQSKHDPEKYGEYSGKYHRKKENAIKEMNEARKTKTSKDYYLYVKEF